MRNSTLEHKLGNWSSAAEVQLVDAKGDVSQVRDEVQTPGYALVNLRSSYQWGRSGSMLGIENLFNQQYYSPLGGAYLGRRGPAGGPGATRSRGHGPYHLCRRHCEVLGRNPMEKPQEHAAFPPSNTCSE